MRSTFLPSISPFPSPVDSVFTRSQSAWESKSLVKSSRRGSVVAGSPARTAAMIRRDFKGLLRRFLLPHKNSPAKSLQRGYQSPGFYGGKNARRYTKPLRSPRFRNSGFGERSGGSCAYEPAAGP